MNNMWSKDKLTIGDVSKMHHISSKMLRYWDHIGLLKPHIVDNMTGYRYYSTSQFYLFNFIKYLKELGVPYSEMKRHLNETEMNGLTHLLKTQMEAADRRIKQLQDIKSSFSDHLSSIEEAMTMKDIGVAKIESYSERRIIAIDTPIPSRTSFEKAIRRLEKLIDGSPTLLLPSVGLLMAAENLASGDRYSFSGAFVPSEGRSTLKTHVRILPAGRYAVLRFWGTIQTSADHYRKLADFMKKNTYIPDGSVMRRCVAPGLVHAMNGHLVEVAVRIQ